MYNFHHLSRGIFLLLLSDLQKIRAYFVSLTHNIHSISDNWYLGILSTQTVCHWKTVCPWVWSQWIVEISSDTLSPSLIWDWVDFMHGLWNFPRLPVHFPLCMPRRISGQNYASLGMCLHKGLLKRSPLCKLGPSNVTNISPRRCTNALRRSGTLTQRPSALACGLSRSNYWSLPFSLAVAACQSPTIPFPTLPSAASSSWNSSLPSQPASRGLRLFRQAPPLPSSQNQSVAPPSPLRRQPSPTSGYRL